MRLSPGIGDAVARAGTHPRGAQIVCCRWSGALDDALGANCIVNLRHLLLGMLAHRLVVHMFIDMHVGYWYAVRVLDIGIQRYPVVDAWEVLAIDKHSCHVTVAFHDGREVASPAVRQADQREVGKSRATNSSRYPPTKPRSGRFATSSSMTPANVAPRHE